MILILIWLVIGFIAGVITIIHDVKIDEQLTVRDLLRYIWMIFIATVFGALFAGFISYIFWEAEIDRLIHRIRIPNLLDTPIWRKK